MTDVTVIIPTIPPRREMLTRAVQSVLSQTRTVDAISIALDRHRQGAWMTRDRALKAAQTEWVAFLDDDDTFLPKHIERLLRTAEETGGDYIYADYEVVNHRGQPFPENNPLPPFSELGPWDNERPHQTCITTLVRTELAQSIGFHTPDDDAEVGGHRFGEDYTFTLRCMEAGAKIVYHDEVTWKWWHTGANTSGLPTNW